MPKTETELKEAPKTTLSKWAAYLLDDLIKVPGTDRRVGLDPLIGLIPGAGDFVSSAAGLTLLGAGIQKGVPKSVYLRMAANWTLNALVGAVPILGDLFSFWYKSNSRNHTLLRAHLDDVTDHEAESQGWTPVIILGVIIALVFASISAVAWWGIRLIWT